jgi:enoyl-CoA hydratase
MAVIVLNPRLREELIHVGIVETNIDKGRRVADLILNRPEKLNAFNAELVSAFNEAFASLAANEDISCIIIRGNGRAFSAGYDLSANLEQAPQQQAPTLDAWRGMRERLQGWFAVRQAPVGVVAAVHGYCMGAAQMLATMSDVRVVAEDSVFGWAGTRGGAGWLGPAMAFFGHHGRAREMELRYGRFNGKQAWEIGWANYAVPESDVIPLANDIADEIARTPRELLEVKKAAMNYVLDVQGFDKVIMAAAQWDSIAPSSASSANMRAHVKEVGLRQALREDADLRLSRTTLNRVTGMYQ